MSAFRKYARYGAVVVLACLLAFALERTNWVRSIENIYYDYSHMLSGVRYAPRHTVFVSIDDETLAALKDDPLVFWAPHFARGACFYGFARVPVRLACSRDLMRDLAVALLWLNLMETGVAKDASGKTEYSYAHPMFWAPFSLVGN